MKDNVPAHLRHFKDFQDQHLAQACKELAQGNKAGHWVWGMWPNPEGFGGSPDSRKFAIKLPQHARDYLKSSDLKSNFVKTLNAARKGAEDRQEKLLESVVGKTDYTKLHSCLTLFLHVEPDNKDFKGAIRDFYFSELDHNVIAWLAEKGEDVSRLLTLAEQFERELNPDASASKASAGNELESLGLSAEKYVLQEITAKQNTPFTATIRAETDTHFYLKVRGAQFRKDENPLIKVAKSDFPAGVGLNSGIKVKWQSGAPVFSKSRFTVAIDKVSEIYANVTKGKKPKR